MSNTMQSAALRYAAAYNWPVFPCRGKLPLTPHGFQDASTSPDQIAAWWARWPNANIGLSTGETSGIVVIDVDPRHHGDESLADLEREHGPLPETAESLTGGGGRHLLFRWPGFPVPCSNGRIGPGIDIKGDGGYIIAPPSVHESGRCYAWEVDHHPTEIPLADLPGWVLSALAKPDEKPPVNSNGQGVIPEGRRDDALTSLAGSARRQGLDEDGIRDVLAAANLKCDPPLPPADLVRIAKSIGAKPAPEPVPQWQAFPTDLLPGTMADLVRAVALATNTDESYAALAAIATAAGCIGNRVAALVKSGWTEPAVCWAAIMGCSGTIKSPVIKLVTRPLIQRLKEEKREYAEALDRYQRGMEAYKAKKKDVPEALPPDPPTERRTMVSDTTIEKLGAMLEGNPLGLLLVRDELAAWLGSFDKYSATRGGDGPAWLSFYGATPLVIDRKTSGSYFIERGAVSVLGSVQPGTLRRVFGHAEREAGLLARILLVHPPQRPSLWTDAGLDDSTARGWSDLLGSLLALPCGLDEDGSVKPRFIPVGRDAHPAWIRWHDAHVTETLALTDPDLQACFAKLKGLCVRLALIFACCDVATSGESAAFIDAETMERALAVTDWLKGEARRIYADLAAERDDGHGPGLDPQAALVGLIQKRGGAITARQLQQSRWQYRSAGAAQAALDELVRAGRGRWEQPLQAGPGHPGGKRFVLNGCINDMPPAGPINNININAIAPGVVENADSVDVDVVDVDEKANCVDATADPGSALGPTPAGPPDEQESPGCPVGEEPPADLLERQAEAALAEPWGDAA